MLCFRHHAKILNRVVPAVFIDVMNNLFGSQEAPQVLLHDEPMLHDIPLAISEGMVRSQAGPVGTISAVADAPLIRRVFVAANVGALPSPFTRGRAELPGPPPDRADVRPALAATIGYGIAPAGSAIAVRRAVLRRCLPAVLRMERLAAVDAFKRHRLSFHDYSIAREERYCEIAARRLQQSVLPLEIPA